ncbi:MAG: AAA family ATPase, partial [Myxococcota bacterium]
MPEQTAQQHDNIEEKLLAFVARQPGKKATGADIRAWLKEARYDLGDLTSSEFLKSIRALHVVGSTSNDLVWGVHYDEHHRWGQDPTTPMHFGILRTFHLNNFKSWRKLSLPLSRLTVLLGKNGAGKSSVLQALDHLYQLSSIPPQKVFAQGSKDDPVILLHKATEAQQVPNSMHFGLPSAWS